MVRSNRDLWQDERVVLVTRMHMKTLFIPAIAFIVLSALGSYLAGFLFQRNQITAMWAAVGFVLIIMIVLCIIPFSSWLAWTVTFTNFRLIEQRGVLKRGQRAVLLNRLSHAEYSQTISERFFLSGTLVVRDLAQRKGLTMRHIPRIKITHMMLSELIAATEPAEML